MDGSSGVVTDGYGTCALLIRYGNGSTFKHRIVYTTAPGGTWTSKEFDTADRYLMMSLAYGDGKWVLVGRDMTPSPRPAVIGTCSNVSGTWVFDTVNTGYSTAGMTGTQYWEIESIGYSGTHWVSTAYQSSTFLTTVRVSTSLTSGWAAPTTLPGLVGLTWRIRAHDNGWWSMIDGDDIVVVSSNPTGTWTALSSTTTLLDSSIASLAWTNGYWVAAGEYDSGPVNTPQMTYLQSDGSPISTFTPVTATNMSDVANFDRAESVAGAAGIFVAGSSQGEIRYSYASTTATPTVSPTVWKSVSGKAFVGPNDYPPYNNPLQWTGYCDWTYVCHAGNYWFAIDRIEFDPLPYSSYDDRRFTKVRISSAAEGPWSIMTTWPDPESYANVPGGSQYMPDYVNGIQFDGTYYYALVIEGIGGSGGSGSTSGSYVYYTTNPLSSWSKFEINKWTSPPAPGTYPANAHQWSFIRHIDGYWVVGGRSIAGDTYTSPDYGYNSVWPAVIGWHTGSSPANAFTFSIDPAVTGYNITDLTLVNGNRTHSIEQIYKMDGVYISLANASTPYRSATRTSTSSPIGPWTVQGNYTSMDVVSGAQIHSNGVMTGQVWNEYNPILFKTSVYGPWQTASHYVGNSYVEGTDLASIAYTDGLWAVVGYWEWDESKNRWYVCPRLEETTSLTGVWVEQHTRFYYPDGWDLYAYSVAAHNGKFVAASANQGELRYRVVGG
jgi:hypothetical protein